MAFGTSMAIDRVNEQPSIDPDALRPQWIPVAERLPETSQNVLITKKNKTGTVRVTEMFYICGTDTTGVIAWMPMPEPYEPDGTKMKADWK